MRLLVVGRGNNSKGRITNSGKIALRGLTPYIAEGATGHVFNPATSGAPIPQKAQLPGNPAAISGWVRFNQPSD
jgi:hypothetical protein